MSELHQKYSELVISLWEATTSGKLIWTPTDQPCVCCTYVSDYKIEIKSTSGTASIWFTINIYLTPDCADTAYFSVTEVNKTLHKDCQELYTAAINVIERNRHITEIPLIDNLILSLKNQ